MTHTADDDSTISDADFESALQAMRESGKEIGTQDGAWVADGNTDEATLRELLRLWDEGDPLAPSAPAPFSGEWAGSSTVEDIVNDCTDLDADTCTPEELDDLASAFEEAYYQAWQDEAERTVRGLLPE